MKYIKFNVEVRPYKDKSNSEDEMNELTKRVLNDINGKENDEEDDYLDDPIWLDTYYNIETIKTWTRAHKGLKNEGITVLYLKSRVDEDGEYNIIIKSPLEEVLEILSSL